MDKEIYVYFDDTHSEVPAWIGTLSAQHVRGREVFSTRAAWVPYA